MPIGTGGQSFNLVLAERNILEAGAVSEQPAFLGLPLRLLVQALHLAPERAHFVRVERHAQEVDRVAGLVARADLVEVDGAVDEDSDDLLRVRPCVLVAMLHHIAAALDEAHDLAPPCFEVRNFVEMPGVEDFHSTAPSG